MEPAALENPSESFESAVACYEMRHASMDELLGADWEELVIKFDQEKGTHVVRTACCPMAPAC